MEENETAKNNRNMPLISQRRDRQEGNVKRDIICNNLLMPNV